MCEQCLIAPLVWRDVLPGWTLVRARRQGNIMEVGHWGLIEMNDPTFIWTGKPRRDPTRGMDEAQEAAYWEAVTQEQLDELSAHESDVREVFSEISPMTGWKLVDACLRAGYKPDRDGAVELWLEDRLARHIEATPPFRDDSFVGTDDGREKDLSLGID